MAEDDNTNNEQLEELLFQQTTDRGQQVDQAIRSGKHSEALRLSLENPPFLSKQATTKDRSFDIFIKAMLAISNKEDQLNQFIENLSDPDAADACMKYVIRGLKTAEYSGPLLRLHALLLDKAGMGCLVRAMVDRKTA